MRRPKKFVVIYLKIRWVCIARLLNRAVEAIHLKIFTSNGVSSRSSWSLSLLSSWSPFWWELQFCSSPWLGARFSRSIVPEEGRSELKNWQMVICDSSGVLWIEKNAVLAPSHYESTQTLWINSAIMNQPTHYESSQDIVNQTLGRELSWLVSHFLGILWMSSVPSKIEIFSKTHIYHFTSNILLNILNLLREHSGLVYWKPIQQ